MQQGVDRPMAAAGAILFAMAFLGLIDNLVTVIARDIGLWQFHFMRALMALPMLAALTAFGVGRLRARRAWAVALRGGFTAAAMLIYFGCLAFMPIAEVAAGLFTAPIWVMLISALCLGHRIGIWRVAAALVGFAGVLLVLSPDTGGLTLRSLIPMAAGVFYALGAIATRQWCAGESAISMLAAFFFFLGLFGAVGMTGLALVPFDAPAGAEGFILRGWVAPTAQALGLTVVQAVGSILAVGLIFRGYQLGEASYVAVIEYSFLIFAAFWSFVLWRTLPDSWGVLGVGLIILSGAIITFRSRKSGI